MPNQELTEIAVILDRSGSMETIRGDMIGGFASFVARQREEPGACVLSLYQFDDEYEVVYEAKPLSEVSGLKLVPRGSTALLDGVGKSIAKIADRHDAMPAAQRPGAVVVLVMTDGQENASREWTLAAVRNAVEAAERKRNWRFVFLGANAAAFAEAQQMGIQAAAHYDATGDGVRAAYDELAVAASAFRGKVRDGAVDARFTLKSRITGKKRETGSPS